MPKARTLSILGKVSTPSTPLALDGSSGSSSKLKQGFSRVSRPQSTAAAPDLSTVERSLTPPLDEGLVILASQPSRGETVVSRASGMQALATEAHRSSPMSGTMTVRANGCYPVGWDQDATVADESGGAREGLDFSRDSAPMGVSAMSAEKNAIDLLENEISWHEIVAQSIPNPNGKG